MNLYLPSQNKFRHGVIGGFNNPRCPQEVPEAQSMVDETPPGEISDDEQNSDSNSRPRAGKRWTDEERMELIRMVHQGLSWAEIAAALGRSETSVMYEFARVVVDGDLVDIEPNFPIEEHHFSPNNDFKPEKPDQKFGSEPGDIYDVIRRRDKWFWYSFKRMNIPRNPMSRKKNN